MLKHFPVPYLIEGLCLLLLNAFLLRHSNYSTNYTENFEPSFFLDGKRSCYGNLFVKMHGVLGMQAIHFQLDPSLPMVLTL